MHIKKKVFIAAADSVIATAACLKTEHRGVDISVVFDDDNGKMDVLGSSEIRFHYKDRDVTDKIMGRYKGQVLTCDDISSLLRARKLINDAIKAGTIPGFKEEK